MRSKYRRFSARYEQEGLESFLRITGVSEMELDTFFADPQLKKQLEGNRKSEYEQDRFLYAEFKRRYPDIEEEFPDAYGYYFSRRSGQDSFEHGIGGLLEMYNREVLYFLDTCNELGLDSEWVGEEVTRLIGKLYNPEDEAYILTKETVFGLEAFGIKETAMEREGALDSLSNSMPFIEYLSQQIAPIQTVQGTLISSKELYLAVRNRTTLFVQTHIVDTSGFSLEKRQRMLANLLCYLFKKHNQMDINDCQVNFNDYDKRIEPSQYRSLLVV